MNLIAAIDPADPIDLVEKRAFVFDNAWLIPVLVLAALFVGYLCFDAWIIRRRNQQMNEWRKRAKKASPADSDRR